MSSFTPDDMTAPAEPRVRLIHDQTIKLVGLIVAAIAGFFLTRAIAASNRQTNVRDAEAWYARGQQALATGRADEAVNALRRATLANRHDARYVMALARALTDVGQYEAASATLLTLRESAPEDPSINTLLARLSVQRQEPEAAAHYYQSAIYAPWPENQAATRRVIRAELIRWLLSQQQTARAISETVALAADVPDDVSAHVEVGQLFARAGDNTHALEQFQRALILSPDDQAALAGAGLAAFQARQYTLADRYLRRSSNATAPVSEARRVTALVLATDPLTPRIGSAERRRRLAASLAHVERRLSGCMLSSGDASRASPRDALLEGLRSMQKTVDGVRTLDDDTIESGVDLIARVEQDTTACGPSDPLDSALVLIGARHGSDAP